MPLPPEVQAALIAGAVSLAIALVSGIYVVRRTSKRIDDLRNELIAKKRTERLLAAAESYRSAFRAYEAEANRLLAASPEDGTAVIQHLLDFYAARARVFYLENRTDLDGDELRKLFGEITATFDTGDLNELPQPKRSLVLRDLGNKVITFSKALYAQSLNY